MNIFQDFKDAYSKKQIEESVPLYGIDSAICIHSGDMFEWDQVQFDLTAAPMRPPFPVMMVAGNLESYSSMVYVIDNMEAKRLKNGMTGFYPRENCMSCMGHIRRDGLWMMLSVFNIEYDPITGNAYDVSESNCTSWVTNVCQEIFEDECYIAMTIHCRMMIHVLQLMNCKNIKSIEADPYAGMNPRKRKRLEERQKEPETKYYTLELVLPMKAKDKTIPGIPTGITKAFHICRGHFSTYGPSNRLFGKYEGTYWIPAHMRGNKKNGEIHKDYKVTENKTESIGNV